MKKINNKGFSLVEILAVMVILGILVGMGLGGYTRYKKKATNDNYRMMSENAATAAEEYYMDHPSKSGYVTFKDLVEQGYLETPIDPLEKGETCYGRVQKYTTAKEHNEALGRLAINVQIDCSHQMNENPNDPTTTKSNHGQVPFTSCFIYPKKIECNNTDGAKFNGVDDYLNMGYSDYDFSNGITMIARIKFNKLYTDHATEFFGNWETAGGGLGINAGKRAYFSLYSPASLGYKAAYTPVGVEIYENTPYIIAGTFDKANKKLRINVSQAVGAGIYGEGNYDTDIDYPVSATGIFVGANPQKRYKNVIYPANASIAEAVLLDQGLTADQIKAFDDPNSKIDVTAYSSSVLARYTFAD